MNSITQGMKYRQSLLTCARKYGKSRSYGYFWRTRYDGFLQSLTCQPRRPHSHPDQHTPAERKLSSPIVRYIHLR